MADIIINPAESTVPVEIVCGNAEAEIVRFVFDRFSDGVDLAGLAWSVGVKNSAGFADVYTQADGVISVEEMADTIAVRWKLYGVATGATGRLLYQLEGLLGKAVIKRFPVHTLDIVSYLAITLSDDAEEDNSQLRETIEYVGNELPKILEAERLRAEGFAKIDLSVVKNGKITRVSAVNTEGKETVASVLDGQDMAIRSIYPTYDEFVAAHPEGYLGDIYAVGDAPEVQLYFWDVENGFWALLGTFEVELPEGVLLDDTVTEDGQNAVTGAAVHRFVFDHVGNQIREALPEPTAEDVGKFLRVDAAGKYALQTVTNAEEVAF